MIYTPNRFPGPNPLDGLGLPEDPELLCSQYLDTYRLLFEQDRTTTIFAYWALASVVLHALQTEDNGPTQSLEIPFWAAKAIMIGFMKYNDAIEENRHQPLGEAMGMEGRGQGKQPRLLNAKRRLRDFKLAFSIALEIEAGVGASEAVVNVCGRFEVSDKSAWRIWGKHKELVTQKLVDFRALSTSGSDGSDLAD